MENPVMKEILEYARARLNSNYGYVGVADGDEYAQLDTASEKDGTDIQIKFTVTHPK